MRFYLCGHFLNFRFKSQLLRLRNDGNHIKATVKLQTQNIIRLAEVGRVWVVIGVLR